VPPTPTPIEGDTRFIRKGGKVDPAAIRAAMDAGDRGDAAGRVEGDQAGDADDGTSVDDWRGGDDRTLRTVSFTLQRDLNKRLDRYLVDRIAFMSRSQLQRLIEDGGVTVNGLAAKASTKLRKGDRVEVVVPPPPSTEIQPDPMPIDVVHEDAWLLVLNKRADVIVHPARSHNRGTLLNGLVHYFNAKKAETRCGDVGDGDDGAGAGLSSVGEEVARPGVVHRLDRDTSGVMVIAKDDTAHWRLAQQFEKRLTDKRYLALVHGVIESDADVVDVPLGPSPSRAKGAREKQAVRHDHLGKPAVTLYRVRERFRSPLATEAARRAAEGAEQAGLPPHRRDPRLRAFVSGPPPRPANIADQGFTLVELELKTGRTHQIRLHLQHLGYPIVADDMYGGVLLRERHLLTEAEACDPEAWLLTRQALHAALLGFTHPISEAWVRFTAPLPDDLMRVLQLLRERFESAGVQTPAGARVDLDVAAPGG
jgi:23S rRNA pseudouridine1911/1915/1917 synthase